MSACMHVCVGEDGESRAGLRAMTGSVNAASHRRGDTETGPVRRGSSVSPRMEFLGAPDSSDCYQI